MIEKMLRVRVVTRLTDRERLVRTLRQTGVLHITAVAEGAARPVAELQNQLRRVNAVLEIIAAVPADQTADSGTVANITVADFPVADLIQQVLTAQESIRSSRSNITALRAQLREQHFWGDLKLDSVAVLRSAGVELRFFDVPAGRAGKIGGVEFGPQRNLGGVKIAPGRELALLLRYGEANAKELNLPEDCREIALPQRDNPSIRQELAELEAENRRAYEVLKRATAARDRLAAHKRDWEREAALSSAENSGYSGESVYALEGWIPAAKRSQLQGVFAQEAELPVLLRFSDCPTDELPPTLIRYPWWTRPIKGLFDILGTVPGYRETDLSPFFVVALPLFAGMLIGDAGYGLLFCLAALLFYRPLKRAAGPEKTMLFLLVGVATLVYGILTANWWGVGPEALAKFAGMVDTVTGEPQVEALLRGSGFWAGVGRVMVAVAPLWDSDPAAARELIMKLSFLLGAIHLLLARLSRLLAFFPAGRAWAELGWMLFILAFLAVIWLLFFRSALVSLEVIMVGLAVGVLLTAGFSVPQGAWYRRWSLGLASSLLGYLGTFSDLMSYIRLMAVGLASFYIAAATNELAGQTAQGSVWLLGLVVLLLGHGLNIALGAIAVFAHGVRLNMLEFSNNAGVQWAGYSYAPFADLKTKEG